MKRFKEIWQYRDMIVSLVKRDIKIRYKGSVLGFLWMFLNPLLQLGVYTIVFTVIMRNGIEDFPLFLFVALVPWQFFSTCLSAGTNVVFVQKELVKKIYFPREVLPIAFTIAQFVNMVLCYGIVILVAVISGVQVELKAWLYLPLIMLVEFLLCLGITYLVSALTVYFRDLEHILGVFTMVWMYLTPVIYPVEMVPEKYVDLFYLNPMTPITIAYRDILYYGQCPKSGPLMIAIIMGVAMVVIGHITFGKLQKRFAEEL